MNAGLKKLILTPFNFLYRLNPAMEIKLLYRLKLGKKLELDVPKTYLEKLNWLKLYYRSELMAQCADKYYARSYIQEKGFGEYLPKLLWYGRLPEDIPWDQLPESFVVKVTSGSGGNLICRDKNKFDKEKAQKQLNKWLHSKYIPCYGEWVYDILEPGIIIEEYLSDGVHLVPPDYKFFCFNGLDGDVGCIAVDLDRFVRHKRNVYDNKWRLLKEVSFGFEVERETEIPKPFLYDQMREIAKTLAKPFPHVRVDFYVIGDRCYIGELTFFNGAGFDRICPDSYDRLMGSWIQLPEKKRTD